MAGETELKKLIKSMRPELNSGEYVFTTEVSLDYIPRENIIGQFAEKEGITVIIEKEKADVLGLQYDFIASWITLTIHSSLKAVGLTAIFASELAKNSIGCNVVAAYYHDHIFVDKKDSEKAMEVLKNLSQNYS